MNLKNALIFGAGVATGWILRSSVDGFRDLTVGGIASAHDVMERMRRFAATEREYFEDLLAEGRARYEVRRARRDRSRAGATPAVDETPVARA